MIDYSSTRLLDVSEAPLIADILFEHQFISKMHHAETQEESILNISQSIKNPNVRCIGYFEHGRLVSFLFQLLSENIPAWHMTLLGTRSSHKWDYSLNGMDACWANAMDFAEGKKVYRIYWSMPEKWMHSQQKTLTTSAVWHRYEIFVDDIIPAGQLPSWPEHVPAFGKRLKPHPTVIKTGLLKNEYRKFN